MALRNYSWKYLWPVSASVLLHIAIAVFVLAGWEFAPARQPPVDPPRYVEARLVELKPKVKQAAAQPDQPQKIDLTERRREQELARQRAEERARERRAQEKREAERAEQKRQEAQRQRELEAQRRAEQEALERRHLREEALREALQEERGLVMEDQYATQAASYMDAIARRIEQNWSRPSSARNGMKVLLSIQMVPTGRVVSVGIIKSSGNAAFDRSAEQAVRQVEVFPEVKDMPPEVFERYYRRFNLLFNPQDLRQ